MTPKDLLKSIAGFLAPGVKPDIWEDVREIFFDRAGTEVAVETTWVENPDGTVFIVEVHGPYEVHTASGGWKEIIPPE